MAEAIREQEAEHERSPLRGLWKPQEGPQLSAIEASWVYELLYGGARGGAKSIFLLLDYLQDVSTYGKAWQGLLVRETYPQLEQIIKDSWKIYPQTGAKYFKQPKYWEWPNGARLKFKNIATVEDCEDIQGHAYPWCGIDEAGNYADPEVFFRILACCRSGDAPIPTSRIRLTANPGGKGHQWLKARYIDHAPRGYQPTPTLADKGAVREKMFIPSRITDNKILMTNDPFYVENLKQQASPELVEAWLHGSWDVQISAYFSEWSHDKHVVPRLILPGHLYRFRSFDWGSAKPFAVHWWAVSDGVPLQTTDGGLLYLQRGALICYREWYGMEHDRPNVGIRLRNEDIAAGILARTPDEEEIGFTTTDSLPFQDRGGPKIAEVFYRCGVPLKRGDTERVSGWQQVRSRLVGTRMGPLIVFTEDCPHMIRTLPALQPDRHNLEDVDSDLEDHAPDGARLACKERPVVRKQRMPAQIKPLNQTTFNELLEYDELLRDE
jgi:hypothetical protein